MNLAWKEIKFYKFRYTLIMLIIFLLGSMVLFISGLAQGLARENISYLNNMPAEHYIVEDNKEPKLESSQMNQSQKDKIEDIIHQDATQIGTQTLKINQDEQDVITFNTPKHLKPKLITGSYPTQQDEIAISEKLTGNDLKVGDYVSFKGHDTRYKISGIMNETMYSHSSMILMNKEAFESMNKQISTFYPVENINKDDKASLNQIEGIKVVDEKTLTDNIASYQAEQMPLNLMIISLFVITAIVLSAFFYVMTIQKIPQIGILKAIGIKTKHLLTALLLQIVLTTMVGVILAFIVILILNTVMPVTMPFYLNYSQVLLMIAVFLIVGLIGALLSFIKVLRVDPIEAIGGME
ncbi:ABC transporter permease [Staphylococcus sp. GDX8P80P]|uniref:ABC transporter permease n=1 Tax=Staphylococcus sp. GDX8P80P TaxID=2804104 RepID=UPI001AEC0B0C|nr:ABC transporter permease [Staphylococcus sp. GDX8P80P]